MTNGGSCQFCGTLTGIHGFAMNSSGKYTDEPQYNGTLCIPMELAPSDMTEDEEQVWCEEFVASLMEHCSKAIPPTVPPKVMFMDASIDDHGIPIPAVMKKIIDKYAPKEEIKRCRCGDVASPNGTCNWGDSGCYNCPA